jgi:hypothetical protein
LTRSSTIGRILPQLRDGSPPGTGTAGTRARFAAASVVLLCLLGFDHRPRAAAAGLELLPKHFVLQPGERIHYQVIERSASAPPRSVDYELAIADPGIVRALEPAGVIEAVRPGRTDLVVRTSTSTRRVSLEVAGRAQPPMAAVPYTAVREIAAKSVLFVGHANRDGFDHTAVARAGIDRVVRDARNHGSPVVYFVSNQYPDWYTSDRQPDYAIVSEGQEHDIHVDAERVTFAGGSFMFCVLRNVQMTLHGMLTHGARRIDFVFPADAVWVEDIWGPGGKRPYPAPMVLLRTLFARRADDAHAYDGVVVPFLDRVINEFPVAGYPAEAPAPPLRDLLTGWKIAVRFGDRFERAYRPGDSDRTLLVEFDGI